MLKQIAETTAEECKQYNNYRQSQKWLPQNCTSHARDEREERAAVFGSWETYQYSHSNWRGDCAATQKIWKSSSATKWEVFMAIWYNVLFNFDIHEATAYEHS